MNNLRIMAILAGLLFGIWPLLMNRSGLSGNLSALIFSIICTVCLLPVAFNHIGSFPVRANWALIIAAGIIGALGLFFFNGMLAKTTPEKVGSLIIIAIVAQTSVPAIYSVIMNGGLTFSKGMGFIAAIVAIFLLI